MSTSSLSSLSSLRSPTPAVIPLQPDHFYGQTGAARPDPGKVFLDPNDDPSATRGIPVFTPTLADFKDFEGYVTRLEPWGMTSGIVKIIPPKEWIGTLPSTVPQLAKVKIRSPIEQDMAGSGGLFRQQNVEKRRVMSVREWAEMCAMEDFRAPTREEAETGRRPTTAHTARTTPARRPCPTGDANGVGLQPDHDDHDHDADDNPNTAEPKLDEDGDNSMANVCDTNPEFHLATDASFVDPASTLPTPSPTTVSPDAADSSRPSKEKQKRTNRVAANATFLETFDPRTAWLPKDTAPQDYTPELCRALERVYWRNCGLGSAPWYGADMQGSLFTKDTTAWNVASLPSALARLMRGSPISGVNTPYLYFGMWRATFAWHVEDMDLFSINYIHFGAPKHWYAVPQARAQAFESTMRGYFPGDDTQCSQFLRHKSCLASPTLLAQSSLRPNVLVQHAGEFVITFPRGYHAGFNLGFNCAESVNFALESWIETGLKAAWCECEADTVRIDVKGLLQEQRQAPPESALTRQKNSPPRKRKKDASSPDTAPIPKRVKLTVTAPKQTGLEPLLLCCLCASVDTVGLLRVHDPPGAGSSACPSPPDGVWRAHRACASVIPETWVDEGNAAQGHEPEVWGVDGIVRDRWSLKCSACSSPRSKLHGAPVQCTKGKCSKAFHVSCASAGASGTAYRVLEEIENEVVLLEPEEPVPKARADATVAISAPPRVIKTIKKLHVEVLCSQHNPALIAQKKANKNDKVRRDLAALPEMSRIRIRHDSGVFEVSLVKVWEDRGTVEVLWNEGVRREFKWGSIVWSATAMPGGRKPTAEDLAKQPHVQPQVQAQAQPPQPSQQQQYNQYSHPGQCVPPTSYAYPPRPGPSSTPPQQLPGTSEYRAVPQPIVAQPQQHPQHWNSPATGYTPPRAVAGYYPSQGAPYQGHYPHPYYQQPYAGQAQVQPQGHYSPPPPYAT